MRKPGSGIIRFLISCAFFFALSGITRAQNPAGVPNDQDKNFVPDKNSIFNAEGKTGSKESHAAVQEIHEVIEMNPFLFVRNIFALQYEHKFFEMLGVQGGLGVCYGKDYMQTFAGDVFSGSSSTGVDDKTILNKGTFKGPNLYLSAAVRLYFNTYSRYTYEERTGYLEMGVRHYKNSMLISDTTSIVSGGGQGGIIRGKPTADVVTNLFYMNYGYHFATEGKIRTTHKFYFGFGLRNSKWDSFDSYQGYNPGTYNNQTYYVKNPTVTKTSMNFIAQFGYELGISYK
ncbi:MAG: hypothetical protein ACHQRM_12555 [Bacteroidia bacterium]